MTDDRDMLRLLTACDLAGTKVVLVGDHRQLGPVGPGGALRALLNRHRGIVHVLADNVRQDDPEEREALRQLRAGNVATAVAWYAVHDRIRIAPDAGEALRATVDAWFDDVSAGRDAAMYAWRRTNVDALNRLARDRWALAGRLTGPDLVAPGGRHFAAGDRIVTLAPAADGHVVTSERGEVASVHVHASVLTVRMDDGRLERLAGGELASDRLAHGYAVTVHRSQASTVDVAHRFEDGGGRELAYVSMSRAQERTAVYVVADSVEQAVEDLTRDWAVEHRVRWAIDSGTPATEPLAVEHHADAPGELRAALRHARLQAEHEAVAAAIPPDTSGELMEVDRRLVELRQDRTDLRTGHGRYLGTPEGEAARHLIGGRRRHRGADQYAENSGSWRDRRHWRKEAATWAGREHQAQAVHDQIVGPEADRLDHQISDLEGRHRQLENDRQERNHWLEQHPEAVVRLHALDRELHPLARLPDIEQAVGHVRTTAYERHLGVAPPAPDHGIGLGL